MSSSGLPSNFTNKMSDLLSQKGRIEGQYSAYSVEGLTDGLSGLFYTGSEAQLGVMNTSAKGAKEFYKGKLDEISNEIKALKNKMDEAQRNITKHGEKLKGRMKEIWQINAGRIREAAEAATNSLHENPQGDWNALYNSYLTGPNALLDFGKDSSANYARNLLAQDQSDLQRLGTNLTTFSQNYAFYQEGYKNACAIETYSSNAEIKKGLTANNTTTTTTVNGAPIYSSEDIRFLDETFGFRLTNDTGINELEIPQKNTTLVNSGSSIMQTAGTRYTGVTSGGYKCNTDALRFIGKLMTCDVQVGADGKFVTGQDGLPVFTENNQYKNIGDGTSAMINPNSVIGRMLEGGATNTEIMNMLVTNFGRQTDIRQSGTSYSTPIGNSSDGARGLYKMVDRLAQAQNFTVTTAPNVGDFNGNKINEVKLRIDAMKDAGFDKNKITYALCKMYPNQFEYVEGGGLKMPEGKTNYKTVGDYLNSKYPNSVTYVGKIASNTRHNVSKTDPNIIPGPTRQDGTSISFIPLAKGAMSFTGTSGILGSGKNSAGATDNSNKGLDAWNAYDNNNNRKIDTEEELKNVILIQVQESDVNGKHVVTRTPISAWDAGIREINFGQAQSESGYDINDNTAISSYTVKYNSGETVTAYQMDVTSSYSNAILDNKQMNVLYEITPAKLSSIISGAISTALSTELAGGHTVENLGTLIQTLAGQGDGSLSKMMSELNEIITTFDSDKTNYSKMMKDLMDAVKDFDTNKRRNDYINVYQDRFVDGEWKHMYNGKEESSTQLVVNDIAKTFEGFLKEHKTEFGLTDAQISEAVRVFMSSVPQIVIDNSRIGTGQPEPEPEPETPAPGTPSSGTPSTGTPSTGTPSTGTPSTGTPSTGTPSTGTPSTGTPSTGTPSTGTPSTGTPSTGTPSSGTPSTGTPAAGTPAAGTPAAPAQTAEQILAAQAPDLDIDAVIADVISGSGIDVDRFTLEQIVSTAVSNADIKDLSETQLKGITSEIANDFNAGKQKRNVFSEAKDAFSGFVKNADKTLGAIVNVISEFREYMQSLGYSEEVINAATSLFAAKLPAAIKKAQTQGQN